MSAVDVNTSLSPIEHVALEKCALGALLDQWREAFPDAGLLALLPEAEKSKLALLQDCCRQAELPLAGALFPALVVDGRFVQDGVLLLRFDRRVPCFLVGGLNDGSVSTEEKIGEALSPALKSHGEYAPKPSLYMIFDGLLPNIATILERLYLRLSDRVCYAGVNAGSETFQPMPCLFNTQRVVGDGVLCLLLDGDTTTVVEHGYEIPDHVMTATATNGTQIMSIDWRPAFEVYQRIIRREYGIDLDSDNFYHYAVHFPFGIPRASEDVVVRIPVALNDDGSLHCVGEVPENAMLVLLRAPEANEGRFIERLTDALERSNGPMRGRHLLTFYCAGRRMHLGEGAELELGALLRRSRVARMAGARSLGERGGTCRSEYPMFHNAALTCTPWGTP
ncbi:MAG: histidine kinase [gamma proteobacterium symbiont of Phacoides pectinatus]